MTEEMKTKEKAKVQGADRIDTENQLNKLPISRKFQLYAQMLDEAQQRVLKKVNSIGSFIDKFEEVRCDIEIRKQKFMQTTSDMNATVKSESGLNKSVKKSKADSFAFNNKSGSDKAKKELSSDEQKEKQHQENRAYPKTRLEQVIRPKATRKPSSQFGKKRKDSKADE